MENRIDACLVLANCYRQLGRREEAFSALTSSFLYDTPRAEILCEIGSLFMEQEEFRIAAYWYRQALRETPRETSGAFVVRDCYDYIPYMQLCVCFDKLGDREQAYRYHLLARSVKPESVQVQQNQNYFDSLQKADG